MPENNARYNVYNNYYNNNIDAGNAAPVLELEKKEKLLSNFQTLKAIIKKHLALVIASAVVICSLVSTAVFYSAAVESNNELTSALSSVSKKQLELDSKKSAYAAILADYDIDEEAAELGMQKADGSIGIILSEANE